MHFFTYYLYLLHPCYLASTLPSSLQRLLPKSPSIPWTWNACGSLSILTSLQFLSLWGALFLSPGFCLSEFSPSAFSNSSQLACFTETYSLTRNTHQVAKDFLPWPQPLPTPVFSLTAGINYPHILFSWVPPFSLAAELGKPTMCYTFPLGCSTATSESTWTKICLPSAYVHPRFSPP